MKNKGFTLLELLVVVLIIGILAAIALPQYKKSVIKAQFAEAYIKLKAAAQIEEMCRLQNGTKICGDESYFEQLDTEINGCQSGSCSNSEKRKNKFDYIPSGMSGENILASAIYNKEDVCLCITKDYNFVLTQDAAGCSAETTKDYSKILGIPDVTDEDSECSCC